MINIIWDMDGTLLDSYSSIIDSIVKTLRSFNLEYEYEYIKDYILATSTSDFFKHVEKEHGISTDMFLEYQKLKPNEEEIKLMPHAKEALDILNSKGIANYIFTHRGKSVYTVLKNNDILEIFADIVDGAMGFKRKPEPDAINYLVNKYSMDKENTYYIGDREIDAKCARNAGIRMIFYRSYEKTVMDSSLYDYKIEDLSQLKDIFKL